MKTKVVNECFRGNGLNLVLRNSNHQNFCDFCYFASRWVLSFRPSCLGTVDITVANDIICNLTVSVIQNVIKVQSLESGNKDNSYSISSYQTYLSSKSDNAINSALNVLLCEWMQVSNDKLEWVRRHVEDANEVFK